MADLAAVFEAEIVALAPPTALVVEDTARVEAEIAADGGHVAVRRTGDLRRGPRDCRKIAYDRIVLPECVERHRAADCQAVRAADNVLHFFDIVQIDQRRRLDQAAAHVDDQIRAAGDEPRFRFGLCGGQGLRKVRGPMQAEVGQRFHQANPEIWRVPQPTPSPSLSPSPGGEGYLWRLKRRTPLP